MSLMVIEPSIILSLWLMTHNNVPTKMAMIEERLAIGQVKCLSNYLYLKKHMT